MDRQTHASRPIPSFGRVLALLPLFVLLSPGCGGGDGSMANGPDVIPPEATEAQTAMQEQMTRLMPMLAKAQSGFLFMLNPDAGLTPGVSMAPDLQPGAPANSYTLSGTYDGTDDAISETTVSGTVTFAGDPSSLDWSPLTGDITVDVDIPVIGHLYRSTLAFTATEADIRISGGGSFDNPVSGITTTIDIPAGTPVIVSTVPGAVHNACGYNLDGSLPIERSGPTGTLNATWHFTPGSTTVAVQETSFRDASGMTTPMPDSSVTLSCGSGGTIDDWVGTYDQRWVCLPIEHGQAQLTLTATGANGLSITDEDPPGSGDVNSYEATTVDLSPRAATGFFIGGPLGNHYREDFTWTLGKDQGFSETSRYRYTEGPNIDSGGICAAFMKRLP